MNIKSKYQAIVLGGGPGGYVAAIRLGQMGISTLLVEREALGGVCLNWGCIPSKALIHAAKTVENFAHAAEIGIQVNDIKVQFEKTQAWKSSIVKKLTGGIGQLLKGASVDVLMGDAKIETANSLAIQTDGEFKSIAFDQIIVATGSKTIQIPGFEIDETVLCSSRTALEWTSPPKSLVVVGGGVIGLEIGMLYQKLGTKVTVVELGDQVLPGVDKDIAQTLQRILKRRKITVHLQSKAAKILKDANGRGAKLAIETPKGPIEAEAEKVLLSVGRAPNGSGIGLENVGVAMERGRILVDAQMRTNIPHIFAIGDVTGGMLLAHKASKEGLIAAEVISGQKTEMDVVAMPGAIFTDPEVATVGLSEDEAKAKGFEVQIGKFPFAASGRAMSTLHTDGFVKIVGEKGSNRLLGVHIIGAHASDLIGEACLALEMGANVEDLALTVHPHPTLTESVMEAAESYFGHAIHIPNR